MLIAEIIDNAFDEEVKPEKFLKISKKIKNALKEVNK